MERAQWLPEPHLGPTDQSRKHAGFRTGRHSRRQRRGPPVPLGGPSRPCAERADQYPVCPGAALQKARNPPHEREGLARSGTGQDAYRRVIQSCDVPRRAGETVVPPECGTMVHPSLSLDSPIVSTSRTWRAADKRATSFSLGQASVLGCCLLMSVATASKAEP